MKILEKVFGAFGGRILRILPSTPELERAVASIGRFERTTGLMPQPSTRTPNPLSRSLAAARKNETVEQAIERIRKEMGVPLKALEAVRAKSQEKSDPFRVAPRKAEKAASARRKPKASDLGPFRVTPRQKEDDR